MVDERKARLTSLTGNLVVFVGLPLVLNGVIFGLGWDKATRGAQGMVPGLPPGWFVGALWLVLFAAMGTARWLLLRRNGGRWSELAEGVSGLAALCLIYPLYTGGLSDDRVGLAGNVITLALAVPLAVLAWRRSAKAGVCLAAVSTWLAYAATVTAIGLAVH